MIEFLQINGTFAQLKKSSINFVKFNNLKKGN